MTVADEVRALAAFRGLETAEIDRSLKELDPPLRSYAELVLTQDGFELITGGRGEETAALLGKAALRHEAPGEVLSAFEHCVAAFPNRMAGLKLCFGPGAAKPTLYVRVFSPLGEGLEFLRRVPGAAPALPALRRALTGNRTLYGLGFFASRSRLGVKTYTISDVPADPLLEPGRCVQGFVSHRVEGGRLSPGVKRYVPDVPLSRLDGLPADWAPMVEFAARRLGYASAGHVGISPEGVKVYVERKGSIPTDFSAR